MKKILATLTVLTLTHAGFAQGYVAWNATPGDNLIVQTNSENFSSLSAVLGGGFATGQFGGAQGNTAGLAGNIYYYELLYSTVDTATPTTLADLAANWTATGLMAQDSTSANNGRIVMLNGSGAAAIDPGYTGGSLSLMLVGWSANLGTTFGGANGVLSRLENWSQGDIISGDGYFGESYVGQTALSTSSVTGTPIFAASQSPGGLISNPAASPMVLYDLYFVPEPGTMALTALGGASLLLLCRRNRQI